MGSRRGDALRRLAGRPGPAPGAAGERLAAAFLGACLAILMAVSTAPVFAAASPDAGALCGVAAGDGHVLEALAANVAPDEARTDACAHCLLCAAPLAPAPEASGLSAPIASPTTLAEAAARSQTPRPRAPIRVRGPPTA